MHVTTRLPQCYSFLATVALIGMASVTDAQFLNCDPEAFKNHDAGSMSREYRAAFLRALDRAEFEEIKAKRGGGGGLDIAGIGLSGSASYEDFNQRREQELTRLDYRQSADEARQYVRNSFDGPGAKAYNACIAAMVSLNQGRGLFLWLIDASDDAATVKIHWRPTAGATTAHVNVDQDVQLIGSPTSLVNFPRDWAPDTEHQMILKRVGDQELRFVVNLGGDAKSVVLPRKPKLSLPATPTPTPVLPAGALDFDNDGRPDTYSVADNKITVQLGGGKKPIVTEIPGYDVTAGPWLTGDFNGDHKLDLAHIVIRNVEKPGYVHIFFGDGTGHFPVAPPKFSFVENANPEHKYDASLGVWSAEDYDGDGLTDLIHNPRLPDGRIHRWRSLGNGFFQIH
ncbi:MAG: FG-GAP repeat domain-containing protein [Candidatus Binatia bacterium]